MVHCNVIVWRLLKAASIVNSVLPLSEILTVNNPVSIVSQRGNLDCEHSFSFCVVVFHTCIVSSILRFVKSQRTLFCFPLNVAVNLIAFQLVDICNDIGFNLFQRIRLLGKRNRLGNRLANILQRIHQRFDCHFVFLCVVVVVSHDCIVTSIL